MTRYSEDDVRQILREDMAKVGGLRTWSRLRDIPNSRVSEFETGRRPPSLPILVALGLTKAIVPLTQPPETTPVSGDEVAKDDLPQRMLASLISGTCGVPRGHVEYNDECICGDREASEALIVLGLAYTSNRWPMAGVFLTGIGESLKERMADPAFVKSLTASRKGR
jgi:hypothetical protein